MSTFWRFFTLSLEFRCKHLYIVQSNFDSKIPHDIVNKCDTWCISISKLFQKISHKVSHSTQITNNLAKYDGSPFQEFEISQQYFVTSNRLDFLSLNDFPK